MHAVQGIQYIERGPHLLLATGIDLLAQREESSSERVGNV
jgi:hypothetical protein